MDNMFRPYIVLAISFYFFSQTSLNAQILNPYSIGSVGMTGSTAIAFSGPILFDKTACLSINNGAKKMVAKNQSTGIFNSNCVVNIFEGNVGDLNYYVYPNPVVSNFIVKGINKNNVLDGTKMLIEVFSIDGKLFTSATTYGQVLYTTGYLIQASNLISGDYFVKVSSNSLTPTILKISKTN